MTMGELLASESWKLIYEECWRMWREGMDRLRKAEDGKTAERAKQMMDDAERILRLPLDAGLRAVDIEDNRYKGKLEAQETKTVREIFNKGNEHG